MDWWIIIGCWVSIIITLIILFSLYLLRCKAEAKKWEQNYHMMESIARSYFEWYVKQNEDKVLEKLPSIVDKVIEEYYNKGDDSTDRSKR